MSIYINGKKYIKAFFNGKYYATGYYNGKIVMISPDYNDYLLAGDDVYLKSSNDIYLSYKTFPQLIKNSLNNTRIEKQPFSFSFKLHNSVISEGTTFILDYPGLISLKSEKNKLAFKFYWINDTWVYINPTNLISGYNKITLSSNGTKLYLQIENDVYTFVDESLGTLTKVLDYTNNGCFVDGYMASGRTSGYLQANSSPSLVGADSWEFGTKFWYIRGPEDYQVIFGPKESSIRGFPELAIQRSNDELYVNVANSATTFVSTYTGIYLNSTNPYRFKVYKKSGEDGVFLGVSYDDRKTYSEQKVSETNQYAIDGAIMTFLNGRITDNRYSPGKIDTSKTYIIVDGTYYSYKEELVYDQKLPVFDIGELKLNLDWTKIAEIKAELL